MTTPYPPRPGTLLRQEPDFEVLAGCRNGEETPQAVRQFRPDVLILDILMPGKDGLAVLREAAPARASPRVILLTAAIDEDNLLEAMRLGVGGVVLKEMAVPLLIQRPQGLRRRPMVERHPSAARWKNATA
jgi:DNA-binding NarL/FixJ family response regulator